MTLLHTSTECGHISRVSDGPIISIFDTQWVVKAVEQRSWSCRTFVCEAVMQPFGSRDYPAASLGRQGPSRPPLRNTSRTPANPHRRHTARFLFAGLILQNQVLCRYSLRDRWRTSAHNADCSRSASSPRACTHFVSIFQESKPCPQANIHAQTRHVK